MHSTTGPAAPPAFEDIAFDFQEPTVPLQFYIIASTPRSGGTYIAQRLWRTGTMGAPHEYFDFYSTMLKLVARLQPETLPLYLDSMMPLRTSANGVFGVKIHFDHLQFMLLSGASNHLTGAKIIYVERRNHIAQAISHARALQTGQWNSLNTTPKAEPFYNPDLIRRCLNHLAAQRRGWQTYFEQQNLSPLRIDYDSFVADPDRITKELVKRMDIPTAPISPVALPEIQPQSDSLNSAWAERFRRESNDGAGDSV